MEELIGQKILSLWVFRDTALIFETENGFYVYVTYGDCCSESWFQDITGISSLINAIVLEVNEISLGEVDGTRQDVDQIYGVKIKTDKGWTDIVFRNSSNGYYGGYLDFRGIREEIDKNVHKDISLLEEWNF